MRLRAAHLACALALAAPAGALAQSGQDLQEAPPFVDAPPIAAPAPTGGNGRQTPAESGQLPDTGADAWVVALLGAALLVSGVGLRLRTTDERF